MTITETEQPLFTEVPGEIANGVYTVIGPRGHRTVKVVSKLDGQLAGKRIVYVMTGPDNLFSYTGVAFLNTSMQDVEEEYQEEETDSETGVVNTVTKKRTVKKPKDSLHVWKSQRGTELHKVVNAWFRILTQGIDGYRFELAKHCIRCNRLLTTPESIERGVGPICAQGGIDE